MIEEKEFIIVEILYTNKDKAFTTDELFELTNNKISWSDFLNTLSKIDSKTITDPHISDHKISTYGINYYSNLLDLKKSQRKTARIGKADTALNIISKILAIVFGISTFILGWLTYSSGKDLKELKNKNQELVDTIEQLKISNDKLFYNLQRLAKENRK